MAGYTGRERQWDLEIDGVVYRVVRQDGIPLWSAPLVPKLAGDSLEIAEQVRSQQSWHLGFGFQRFAGPGGYDYADAIDSRGYGELVMGPLVTTFTALGNITSFFQKGSDLYVCATRYVQQVDTTNDHCETPNNGALGKDLAAGAAATVGIPWASGAIVYLGNSDTGWIFASDSSWTEMTVTPIQGAYGGVFYSREAPANVTFRTFLSASNPSIAWLSQGATIDSADWGATYSIGDNSYAVTGAVGAKEMAWVAKRNGLYYVDRAGRSVNVLDGMGIDDNNGVNLSVDSEGYLWYPGRQLIRYNPNDGSAITATPGEGLSHDSPIYGRVTCHVQYKGWHYVWIYNGTTSYLMAARSPGDGPFFWHGALCKVTGEVKASHVWTRTAPPRLYFGYGATVGYIRLEEPYRYAASGSIYFSADNLGTAGTKWALGGFTVDNEGCNTATYIDLYAKLDGGEWQKMDSVKASGLAFVPVPSGLDPRFTSITYRLDFTNSSSLATPRVYATTLRATRRPLVRNLIQTAVYCSNKVMSDVGIQSRLTGAQLLTHLEQMQAQGPVPLVDYWTGERRTQRVLMIGVVPEISREHGWDEAVLAVRLSMVRMSSETVETEAAASGAVYGEAIYGTDRYS